MNFRYFLHELEVSAGHQALGRHIVLFSRIVLSSMQVLQETTTRKSELNLRVWSHCGREEAMDKKNTV